MTRHAALLLTALLVVASVSALPAAATATSTLAPSSTALQPDTDPTNVTPGQRLAGIVGAGQAEFAGEVELRAYGIQFAHAKSNASKAAVVGDRLETVRQRLAELEQRRESLRKARENGSMSEGEFQARVTAVAARSQQLEALANASEARASQLPDDVLASKGINVTAIRTLSQRAGNLSGPEVAAIARSIAGPEVGRPVSDRPPSGVPQPDVPGGPPEDPAGAANSTADNSGQGNGAAGNSSRGDR